MKNFDAIEIDLDRSKTELREFGAMLDGTGSGPLNERQHILGFFRDRRHLSALIGYLYTACGRIDRIAYEFDFFGDYAADLVVGDSERATYTFIEFENAASDSIFKKAGKKQTLEWSQRFEKGYSQIIDWFWKMSDMSQTGTLRDRFDDAGSIQYQGLLVIGRSTDLEPLQQARLTWRREKVVVDSKHINCFTFDELRWQLEDKLRIIGLMASDETFHNQSNRPPPLEPGRRQRRPRRP